MAQLLAGYSQKAIEFSTSRSIPELQCTRLAVVDHRRAGAAALPQDPSEPFHSALVEEMDRDLDRFNGGPERFSEPLQVLRLACKGAEVRGAISYDQAFT